MPRVLYAVAAILVVLWVIGFIFKYIISPLVHLLLVVAAIVLAMRFLSSKFRREV